MGFGFGLVPVRVFGWLRCLGFYAPAADNFSVRGNIQQTQNQSRHSGAACASGRGTGGSGARQESEFQAAACRQGPLASPPPAAGEFTVPSAPVAM